MSLDVRQIPVLSDNYVYLVRESESGNVAVVDPAVAEPVLRAADKLGWTITHILNTHHHGDHVGGNLAVQKATGCHIVGPRADRQRIPGLQTEVGDGDTYAFGAAKAHVFDVPGHTRGHIAYWFAADDVLFPGDTLFALGCWRLFEGTPAQMWESLGKLKDLPDGVKVYCAHEYTQANAKFALSLGEDNAALADRAAEIEATRAAGKPTVPSTLGEEKRTNPFLRADQPALARAIDMAGAPPVAVFTEVRRRKDSF